MEKSKLYDFITRRRHKPYILRPILFYLGYRIAPKKIRKRANNNIRKFTEGESLSFKQLKYLRRDMVYCRMQYHILFNEYFLYNFRHKNKSNCSRKGFIPNADRRKYLRLLGTEKGRVILNNKYKAYKELSKFYKRDMIRIAPDSDFKEFEAFIKKHPVFVKKPINKSLGAGVALVNSKDYKNLKDLFENLQKNGVTILEEQVFQHKKMASLHPDSLNTVRVVTYLKDDGEVIIHLPFIKIGQGGSFVDNGGAGGIFALVDADTGKLITDGKDEANKVYVTHPNTGVKIKDFQIPEWKKVKKFAIEIAKAFPHTKYIGWDIAISKDKGPLIIEGNSRTQFYGQQITDEIGKKKSMEKLINYKKLKKQHMKEMKAKHKEVKNKE